MQSRLLKICILVTLLIGMSTQAVALNSQNYRPHTGGGAAGYHLFSSSALKPKEFSFGLFNNYARNPLEIAQTTASSTRFLGLVDHMVTTDIMAGYGIADRVTILLAMPIHSYYNIAPTLTPSRNEGYFGLGDLRAAIHIQILDPEETKGQWGLAIIPFGSVPTGDLTIYGGDDSYSGGATIAFEKLFKSHRFYLNLGAEFRQSESFLNLGIDHNFQFGLGGLIQLSKKHELSWTNEFFGNTQFDSFFSDQDTMPIDWISAIEKGWSTSSGHQFLVHIGGGMGLTTGHGSPDYRVLAGLTWRYKGNKKETPKPQKVVIEEAPKPTPPMQVTTLTLSSVGFKTGRYQLVDAAKQELTKLKQVIAAKANLKKIVVRGYADYYGGDYEYNLKLANQRAQTIADLLRDMGVQIPIESEGEVYVDPNNKKSSNPHYRKTDIFLWQLTPTTQN